MIARTGSSDHCLLALAYQSVDIEFCEVIMLLPLHRGRPRFLACHPELMSLLAAHCRHECSVNMVQVSPAAPSHGPS